MLSAFTIENLKETLINYIGGNDYEIEICFESGCSDFGVYI